MGPAWKLIIIPKMQVSWDRMTCSAAAARYALMAASGRYLATKPKPNKPMESWGRFRWKRKPE